MQLDRKAAKDAYKKRQTIPGIYAVRCIPTGEVWVGQTPDVEAINNRLTFTLQQGVHPHQGLQRAWTARGADSFAFAVIERLTDADELAYLRRAALKERLAYWRTSLDAAQI